MRAVECGVCSALWLGHAAWCPGPVRQRPHRRLSAGCARLRNATFVALASNVAGCDDLLRDVFSSAAICNQHVVVATCFEQSSAQSPLSRRRTAGAYWRSGRPSGVAGCRHCVWQAAGDGENGRAALLLLSHFVGPPQGISRSLASGGRPF